MPENLFVACRVGGELNFKRVELASEIQNVVHGMFRSQEQSFFDGVEEEVAFEGSWKPEDGELLTVEAPDEAGMFLDVLDQNVVSVPSVDAKNFASEGIKALFIRRVADGNSRVLIQSFNQSHVLSRKLLFTFLGGVNIFSQLEAPVFCLPASLACVIEGELLKFKSFQVLRTVIDTTDLYRAATDPEVIEFTEHEDFVVDDLEDFVLAADQTTRKLISSIRKSGILGRATPTEIKEAAAETQLDIEMRNGKIVLPADRHEKRELLRFLDESRYSGPLSGVPYITNSRRRVPAS